MVSSPAPLDLSPLLERTARSVQDLGWQTVVVVLRDEATQTTYPAAVVSHDPALAERLRQTPPVPFREDAWRQEQYRLSRSYFVDHRLHRGLAEFAGDSGLGVVRVELGPRAPDEWQTEDLLVVPLELDGAELGWLSVDDPADRQRPTLEKVRALEVFADQAALVIQQTRLYQQVRDQMIRQKVLNEIAHAISQHLEMGDLLAAMVTQLEQIFTFQRATILLREGQHANDPIFSVHDRREPAEDWRGMTPLEDLAYRQIIQGGEPCRVAEDLAGDAALDSEFALLDQGIRSYAILPLIMWNQVIGAFSLAAEQPHAFHPADTDFLRQITEHIAGAVWNALLYDLEQRRRHAADALARLSKIVNSTLELEEVLELALEQLARVITYDTAAIMLVEGPNLRITACRGFQEPEKLLGAVFRVEENNVSHEVMRVRQARVEQDVQRVPNWGHQRDDVEGAHTIRAWIGAPLVVRGESIGILTIDKFEPDFYSEEDGETATAFAAQIATAIQNARLYKSEHRKRQTAAAMARLAQTVNSTLEMNEVLELALQQLARVITYDTASILLVEGPNLKIAACHGFTSPKHVLGTIIQPDEANFGYGVLKAQQTRVVADVRATPDWNTSRDDIEDLRAIRAWIGTPLVVRGESIGVLTIDKREPDFYSEEDAETAAAFGAQIAIAIHNARLYQAAEQQRDRLTAILTDTTDAVIVVDRSRAIWLLNPAAARHLRLEAREVIGQPVTALHLPELAHAFESVRQSGQPGMTEIPGPEGAAFHASIAPVRDVGWVIVMQDITPLKELDRLRTEWVAAVSHDLKNPIQVVQLGTALLEMDGPLNDLQLERVAIIQRSTEQLSKLVTDVLDLARLEAGPALRAGVIDPEIVILSAVNEIEHLAQEKGQALEVALGERLPPLWGDGALLIRVLSNLLSNAVKYTPEGGQIEVRARQINNHIEIDVMDNGQGIPAESLPHIFDRFYRVPGTRSEGTGLGLSIVKSIVEKHNGTVTVDSHPGEGSTFTLALPVARG